MSLVAGFVGTSRDDDGRLRPEIGWAVTDRVVRKRFHVGRSAFSGLPQLRPRKPIEPDLFDHLPVDGIGEFSLDLSYWAGDPAGLLGVEGLEELVLHECSQLTSLAPLEGLRVPRLRVTQCRHLHDVRALASMPVVELALWHLDALKDWSPVAELKGLRKLSIFGRGLPEDWCGEHEGEAIARIQAKLRDLG